MLADVREALLDDPVGSERHPFREQAGESRIELERHRVPRLACLGHEPLELGQPGLTARRDGVPAAQHVEQADEVGLRLLRRAPDLGHRRPGAGRIP